MNVNSNGRSLTVQNQTQNQLYNLRLRELLPLGRLSIPSGMQVGVRVEKDGSLSPYLTKVSSSQERKYTYNPISFPNPLTENSYHSGAKSE